ncbi:MAG: hypothetical protein ABI162_06945 [Luteolibacter sp.]
MKNFWLALRLELLGWLLRQFFNVIEIYDRNDGTAGLVAGDSWVAIERLKDAINQP